MLTRVPRPVSVALALSSSVPVDSMLIVAALMLSYPLAWIVIAPLLLSIFS